MNQVVLDGPALRRTLGRLAHEILESNGGSSNLVVIGILRRGWPLAKRLAWTMAQIEDQPISHGKLDIRGSRDDKTNDQPSETEIPFSLTDRNVVLVDEVIFTGRTARSALNELMKHGRPAKVQLVVLVDRGHRELPIQPDFLGRAVPTKLEDHIEVRLVDYSEEDIVILQTQDELIRENV